MNKSDFEKLKEIFAQVVEAPDSQQNDLLKRLCGDDSLLLDEAKSLLESHNSGEKLIENNALGFKSLTDLTPHSYEGIEFGHYRIIREIGHGGMGSVFLAERSDGEFDQKVALKIVRQTIVTSELERYFRRERQILASLNHQSIAKLLDGGVSERGEPFFAMEYVEGKPLLQFAEQLSINEKLQLFLKICNAVSYAHRNLVIHRDIKPSNILVTEDGEPKLLDFGLAKIEDENFSSDSTQTAFRALTPAYASPEQLKGETITTASDTFSLGVVFYELLTGKHPHETGGKTLNEIIKTVTDNEPILPSKIQDSQSKIQNSLVGDLDNIVLTSLRKEPERRYKSVEVFADDIERHLNGFPVSARPNTFTYQAERFYQRNRALVLAASLTVLSLFIGVIVTLWQANIARQQRDRAEQRFNDVRKLSRSLLFEITPKIERLQGSTEARELLVLRAMEYLDSLANESINDVDLQSELASAYEKIGELQGNPYKPNLNDFAGAIASYEKAQVIRGKLPQTPENQRLLAENYVGVSNAHFSQNDISKTLEVLQNAQKLYQSLIDKHSTFDIKVANVNTQIEIGATYSSNNQYETAIQIFERSITMLGDLDQDEVETKRLTAKTLAQFGNALSWNNRQSEAEIKLEKSVEIIESLLREFPNDTNIRKTAFQIYGLNSSDYEEIKNDVSLKFAEKHLEIALQNANADSFDMQAKLDTARANSRVGICLINLGEVSRGISKLREAEIILNELAISEPKNKSYQRDLAKLHVRFADAKKLNSDIRGALISFQRSAEIFESISNDDKKNTLAQRDFAQSLKNIGELSLKLQEIKKARQSFVKSLEILKYLRSINALGATDEKLIVDVEAALKKI